MLKEDFQYFIDNQAELVKKYGNKYIVIKQKKVIGSYDSREQAYFETIKVHELGTFLIQLCSEGEGSYTQIFHSRVQFV